MARRLGQHSGLESEPLQRLVLQDASLKQNLIEKIHFH
jgi:hypothetical protein